MTIDAEAGSGVIPADEELTRDWLLGHKVSLIQPARGYRVAIDPVLLAAFVPLMPGQSLLDLGCGTGAALLCVQGRARAAGVPGEPGFAGLEKDPVHAALAEQNQRDNGFNAPIIRHDLAEKVNPALFPDQFPPDRPAEEGDTAKKSRKSGRQGFHHVIMNPPFMEAGTAGQSPHKLKNRAHVESPDAGLKCWVRRGAELLRPGGRLAMVHRADRLPSILAILAPHFGEITVFPLWPREGVAARRVLVAGRKGSGAPARLLPGLVLHTQDGNYTAEADRILRGAAIADCAGDIQK